MENKPINLYKKLLDIQQQIKGLSKDKKSYSFEYVTGNKLLGFIRPLMDKHGLLLKQEVISIENTRQDYKVFDKISKDYKEKSEILSKVLMRFTWIDTETGETDENLFGANGQNDWEKGLGSALTYGERYFILKYFHIPTDEDDIDNPDRKQNKPVESAKQKQFNSLYVDNFSELSVQWKGKEVKLSEIASRINEAPEDLIDLAIAKLKI